MRKKAKWDPRLPGFVLSCEKLRILNGGKAILMDDSPYLQYLVKYDIKFLRPQVGSKVKAAILRITSSHITMTISSTLTAIIPSTSLNEKRFKMEQYYEDIHTAAADEDSEEDLHAGDDDEGITGIGKVAKFKVKDIKKDKTL